MANKYDALFQPFSIGKVKLKNRIGMAPMGTNHEDSNGLMMDAQIAYYVERAKGGAGLILTEGQFVTRITDPMRAAQKGIDTDEQAQMWGKIAEEAHKYGAKVGVQLIGGLGFLSAAIPDAPQPTSASNTPNLGTPSVMCRELTVDEIHEIADAFGRCAGRAARVGVDMIEINAHLGYLLDQFMTPAWNHRTDMYGGSLENRMRFPKEIVEAIRSQAGPDVPIIFRIGIWHDCPNGRTLEEGIELCKYLEQIGVDALDLNIGQHLNEKHAVPYVYEPDGFAGEYVQKVKENIEIPVLCAGKHTPETALSAIENRQTDVVLFGRALVADPNLPDKLMDGKRDDIRPCMSCNQRCLGGFYLGKPVSCAGNFLAGHELEYSMEKTKSPKKVAVIGGGPAGMEAARVAALKGHDVTLYEKSNKTGGELNAACVPKFKWRVGKFSSWLARELDKLGVDVVLNTEITADSPELRSVDHIIIALGAKPLILPIKGSESEHVVEVTELHAMPEKLRGNHIVVCGGGMSGCDCALDCAMDGRDVTIIEMTDSLIPGEKVYSNRLEMGYEFEKYGVKTMLNTRVMEFVPDGVVVENKDGTIRIPADTIITAFGMKPEKALADAIKDRYPSAVLVGECNIGGGQIGGAVESGFIAGWSIA